MFERRIQNQLHEWAEKNNRKPLILRGARQVGKTTIVEQFGKEFDNFLSLNLEKKEAKDLFESTDDVKMLLPLLFLYDNKPQRPGRTLLFIDEIQSSTSCCIVAVLLRGIAGVVCYCSRFSSGKYVGQTHLVACRTGGVYGFASVFLY